MARRALWNPEYRGVDQQDAHEACMSFLDSCNDVDQNVLLRLAGEHPELADEIRAPSRQHTTPFWMIFGGVERSALNCRACSGSSDTDAPFATLQVTIPPDESHPSVESALRHHFSGRRG